MAVPEPPPSLKQVLIEHLEEASFVWVQRNAAVSAPNYSPKQFADLDERLEAHIDGLRVGGIDGWKLAQEVLDSGMPEDFFPASVLAIEDTGQRFEYILTRAFGIQQVVPAVISALGWVDPKFLSGRVKSLLGDALPLRQMLGIAACAVHRKDPGSSLEAALTSPAPAVRSRGLRTAGELGRADLLPRVLSAVDDQKSEARFWACRSALLLGNRGKAIDALIAIALRPGARQLEGLQLVLQAVDVERGHDLLTQFADVPSANRLCVIGSGLVGASTYVPWLIEQMTDPMLARVAAEAFVNITGADFNLNQLEAMPPEDFEDGPTEDPEDENVDVPEDVTLPWPDVPRVKSWWEKNRGRFATGTRYFLGAPVTAASCVEVLKAGFQRQRVAAALHLTLLKPGTPLFNTSAPARRQQDALARLG
jgi:uncharacterized protein (TIGR02270 family)